MFFLCWRSNQEWEGFVSDVLVGCLQRREQGLRLLLPAAKDVQDLMKSWVLGSCHERYDPPNGSHVPSVKLT